MATEISLASLLCVCRVKMYREMAEQKVGHLSKRMTHSGS